MMTIQSLHFYVLIVLFACMRNMGNTTLCEFQGLDQCFISICAYVSCCAYLMVGPIWCLEVEGVRGQEASSWFSLYWHLFWFVYCLVNFYEPWWEVRNKLIIVADSIPRTSVWCETERGKSFLSSAKSWSLILGDSQSIKSTKHFCSLHGDEIILKNLKHTEAFENLESSFWWKN
jgi:hypothetical protein